MDGEIKIMQKDIYLNFKIINKNDLEILRKQRKEDKVYVLTNSPNKAHVPSPNHPWKKQFVVEEYAKVGHFNLVQKRTF